MAAIDDTIQVKRRIIEDLRPTLLDNLGIGAALKWQCSQFGKRWGVPCRVEMQDENLRLSPAYSIAFYRVVQEALTNISKYAQAKNVAVSLLRDGDHWVLRIADDGVGIDTSARHNTTAHGLVSMRERARALGGEFSHPGPARTRHGRRSQRADRAGAAVADRPPPCTAVAGARPQALDRSAHRRRQRRARLAVEPQHRRQMRAPPAGATGRADRARPSAAA